MMKRPYIKLLLLILGMGFCIFWGVDLATRGVERIQGPIVKAASEPGSVQAWAQGDKNKTAAGGIAGQSANSGGRTSGSVGASKAAEAKIKKEEVEPKAEINESTGIARIGNKTGELLQIVAHHGIRLFVSLFEVITG
jgi:hypothetical protein